MDQVVHVLVVVVHTHVSSNSGAGGIHPVNVHVVMIKRQVPTVHRRQPFAESSHVQNTDEVVDAPHVVQRQLPTGQQSCVLLVRKRQGPTVKKRWRKLNRESSTRLVSARGVLQEGTE